MSLLSSLLRTMEATQEAVTRRLSKWEEGRLAWSLERTRWPLIQRRKMIRVGASSSAGSNRKDQDRAQPSEHHSLLLGAWYLTNFHLAMSTHWGSTFFLWEWHSQKWTCWLVFVSLTPWWKESGKKGMWQILATGLVSSESPIGVNPRFLN